MGAIELFLTLIGAAATALLLGPFAQDAVGIPIDTICVERDISRTSILHISTYQRTSTYWYRKAGVSGDEVAVRLPNNAKGTISASSIPLCGQHQRTSTAIASL